MIDKWWAKDEWVGLIFMIGYMAMKENLPSMWAERIVLILLAAVMIYFVIMISIKILRDYRNFNHQNIEYFIDRKMDFFIIWLIPVLFKFATFYLVYVVMMVEWGNLWNYIMVFGVIILVLIMFDEYFERHSDLREVINRAK
ncbi:hypothetical protein ACMGE9_09455 [Macrococcus sp. EM39E]|uniref:hypothetical protein n=1 Tax=Macrococcus animalis TaxID=3395467 RepID=UPI0039BF4EB0